MSAFLTAAIAKMSAGRSPAPRIYKTNAVPASPTFPYSVVSVVGDQAGNYTLDARHSTRDYRITVQSFGRDVDGALAYDTAAIDRLLDESLTVAGFDCGPIRLQVGSAIVRDPDDNGVVGVTSSLLFTTTKEAW